MKTRTTRREHLRGGGARPAAAGVLAAWSLLACALATCSRETFTGIDIEIEVGSSSITQVKLTSVTVGSTDGGTDVQLPDTDRLFPRTPGRELRSGDVFTLRFADADADAGKAVQVQAVGLSSDGKPMTEVVTTEWTTLMKRTVVRLQLRLGSPDGGPPGSGGAVGTGGGDAGTGGNGGAVGTGGSIGSGGGNGSGGAAGAPSGKGGSSASGGTVGSGGAAVGGRSGIGGMGVGGRAGSGGATGSGGITGSGGTTGSGGGTTGSGGSGNTGGMVGPSSGGAMGSAGRGGSGSGSGGTTGSGGAAGSTGAGGAGGDNRIVLFDGSVTTFNGWAPVTNPNGPNPWIANADGTMTVGNGDIQSKMKFHDLFVHVEYMTPVVEASDTTAIGQNRGNSGVLLNGSYEMQILDTYGQAPANDGCGAVYRVSAPSATVCYQGGMWNTYEIEFKAPACNAQGQKTTNARIVSATLNGQMVQQNVDVPSPTTAGQPETCNPAGLLLQSHTSFKPVMFRNIWVIPRN